MRWSAPWLMQWLRPFIVTSILVGSSISGPETVVAQETEPPGQPIQPAPPRVRNLAQPAYLSQWYPVGRFPARVTELVVLGDTLFALTSGNRLWSVTLTQYIEQGDLDWHRINSTPGDVVGMAALGGRLFAATGDGKLWALIKPLEADSAWRYVGRAPANLVAMTAHNDKLYAATSAREIWDRNPAMSDIPWRRLGATPGALLGMASLGEPYERRIYAVSASNEIFERDPDWPDPSWKREAHRGLGPGHLVAMTGYEDNLLAATSSDDFLWVCAHRWDVRPPNRPVLRLPPLVGCGGWAR